MKPVGLLYDSVSNNTGDDAIGLVMQRLLTTWGVPHDVVDPFAVDTSAYSCFVIGGGKLLRPPGDPFYDAFRVRGRHILNTVGVQPNSDPAYLSEYAYVSVRSATDRDMLRKAIPAIQVAVAPCVSLLMEPETTEVHSDDAIGVHFNAALPLDLDLLVSIIRNVGTGSDILFIPFTHYNNDRLIMQTIAEGIPGTSVAPILRPGPLFHLIGRLRCIISTSLHAALFAYAQNVPCIAFPITPKIDYFFGDRGLEQWLFRTPEEMADRLHKALDSPPDYSAQLEEDHRVLDGHLSRLRDLLPRGTSSAGERYTLDKRSEGCGQCSGLRRQLHAQSMQALRVDAEHRAAQIRLLRRIRDLEARIPALERTIEQQKNLIQAIERGKVMRALNALHRWWNRVAQRVRNTGTVKIGAPVE